MLTASELAPLTVGRQGNLEYLILDDGTQWKFNSHKAYATMDRRRNIWFIGDVQFPSEYHAEPNQLMILGKVQRFSYRTVKAHIENGNVVSYYHDFGEVDGQQPTLAIDSDGMPVLIGGNYAVKREGVIN